MAFVSRPAATKIGAMPPHAGLRAEDRDDPLTEMIAKTIIKIAQTVHDPAQISALAIKELGLR
jgi:hypothetical protein